jgi:hypothetical protein
MPGLGVSFHGLYVHGGTDTTGAVRAVDSITTGLQWCAVRADLRHRPASQG